MAFNFNIGDLVVSLQKMGVYDYLLPFLLIFSIIFAMLEKTKILGSDKTNINAVVSVVIGLLLIVQTGIVSIINAFLPRVSLIIVIFLMAILLIAILAGKEFAGFSGSLLGFAIVVAIISIIISLAPEFGGYGSVFGSIGITSQDQSFLLGLGILILVGYLVVKLATGKPASAQTPKGPGIFERIGKGLDTGMVKK